MKHSLTTLALVALTSSSALAGSLVEGNYTGEGGWKKTGSVEGQYKVETRISASRIDNRYVFPGMKPIQWSAEITPKNKGGFFSVKMKGHLVGHGYCLEQADVCHYEFKAHDTRVEETLVWQNGRFFKFGSKNAGSGLIRWQEALDPVTSAL